MGHTAGATCNGWDGKWKGLLVCCVAAPAELAILSPSSYITGKGLIYSISEKWHIRKVWL